MIHAVPSDNSNEKTAALWKRWNNTCSYERYAEIKFCRQPSLFVSNIVTFFVFLRPEKTQDDEHWNWISLRSSVIYWHDARQGTKKLFYNISLVSMGVIDSRIFKKLGESGIWEFRAEYESNEYRLLSFWDKTRSSIVIATHGFDKKTRKTPKQEIEHAESIRNNYYKTR